MQSLNWNTLVISVGFPNMSEVLFFTQDTPPSLWNKSQLSQLSSVVLFFFFNLNYVIVKSKINKISAEYWMLLTTIDINQSKKIRNSHNN